MTGREMPLKKESLRGLDCLDLAPCPNGTDVTFRAAPQPPILGELEFKVPQNWGI
jgi:hypothetical protein